MKLRSKLYYTFAMFMMSPMLRDDPKSTEASAKRTFWDTLKKLWRNELDKEFKDA
jgi:hypothetical protein